MNGHGKSDSPVVCAGRRVLLAGGSPAGPFQAGSVAKGGGNASPGAAGLHGAGRRVIVGRVMVARAGRRGGNAAACSAIRLSHGVGCCSARCNVVGERRAGQGAHREVGSEGFEANRRAVAELTANRSARSWRKRACIMEAKQILGTPGRNKVCAVGTA
jgi:hypothetical protein